MKIVHISTYQHYLANGGTEVYIDSLSAELEMLGIQNFFVVLNPQKPQNNNNNSIRFFNPEKDDISNSIVQTLAIWKPDAIILHTLSGYELVAIEYAIERGIPSLFFFHALDSICYQRGGKFVNRRKCSHFMHPLYCSICICSLKYNCSIVSSFARLLSTHFLYLVRLEKSSGYKIINEELNRKRRIIRNITKIVTFNEVDTQLFLNHGISKEKIVCFPQGLSRKILKECQKNSQKTRTGLLNIGYIGRCSYIKGCDILVNAALLLPNEIKFKLHIYGCHEESEFFKKMKLLSQHDERIIYHTIMPSELIIKEYSKLDVLCIPSIVHETGPLTLLEGAYSGCLVAGSSQIGQIDFLREYGTIVNPNTPQSWRDFFVSCVTQIDSIRAKCPQIITDVRTQSKIAHYILTLLLSNRVNQ